MKSEACSLVFNYTITHLLPLCLVQGVGWKELFEENTSVVCKMPALFTLESFFTLHGRQLLGMEQTGSPASVLAG